MKSNMSPFQSDKFKSKNLSNLITRSCLVLLTISISAVLVSACSFRPLYGNTEGNQELQQVLSSIEVVEIPGRVGQKVRNELIFKFTGGGHPSGSNYRLVIAVRESATSQLVRRDGDSRGQFYKLAADFQLYSASDPKNPLLKGISHAQASFKDDESVYANVRSRRDAEDRAAKTVAEDLQVRISAFLSSNS